MYHIYNTYTCPAAPDVHIYYLYSPFRALDDSLSHTHEHECTHTLQDTVTQCDTLQHITDFLHQYHHPQVLPPAPLASSPTHTYIHTHAHTHTATHCDTSPFLHPHHLPQALPAAPSAISTTPLQTYVLSSRVHRLCAACAYARVKRDLHSIKTSQFSAGKFGGQSSYLRLLCAACVCVKRALHSVTRVLCWCASKNPHVLSKKPYIFACVCVCVCIRALYYIKRARAHALSLCAARASLRLKRNIPSKQPYTKEFSGGPSTRARFALRVSKETCILSKQLYFRFKKFSGGLRTCARVVLRACTSEERHVLSKEHYICVCVNRALYSVLKVFARAPALRCVCVGQKSLEFCQGALYPEYTSLYTEYRSLYSVHRTHSRTNKSPSLCLKSP